MNWKKALPTLIPLALALITAVTPMLQSEISTYVAPFLAHHQVIGAFATVVVTALYHALPSPVAAKPTVPKSDSK